MEIQTIHILGILESPPPSSSPPVPSSIPDINPELRLLQLAAQWVDSGQGRLLRCCKDIVRRDGPGLCLVKPEPPQLQVVILTGRREERLVIV